MSSSVTIFVIFGIILYFICKNVDLSVFYLFPRSEIVKIPRRIHQYKIDVPCRKFEYFDKVVRDKISETFEYVYTDWIDDKYEPATSTFEGFECIYHKTIPVCDYFEPLTLFYFPKNDIKWDSEMFLYGDGKYYYPESNSVLCVDSELRWSGSRDVNVLIFKKK